MEEINLDLERNSHKNLNVSLSSSNSNPSEINLVKQNILPKESNIGLDLLVNRKKTGGSMGSPVITLPHSLDTSATISDIGSTDNISNPVTQPVSNINSSEVVDLDTLLGDDLNSNSIDLGPQINVDTGSSNNMFSLNTDQHNLATPLPPPKTFEEIQKEKSELLRLLDRMEVKGIRLDKKYTMESDYNEMKNEYERIKQRRAVDQSVRFQRKMLVAFVTGMEFLNSKFDPFDLKLDGWSESIHENVIDYDDIFEELHEKYKEKAHMAPELKLLLMLGGSGFMFHLTNTMFKTSLPGMGDILKQNPDLMQQFTKAAVNSMSSTEPGFSNLMGDVLNTGDRTPNMNTNMPQQQPSQQSMPSAPPSRREMSGPPNIDDILHDISNKKNSPVELDLGAAYSDSDMETVRNIEISKRGNKRGMTLDL